MPDMLEVDRGKFKLAPMGWAVPCSSEHIWHGWVD